MPKPRQDRDRDERVSFGNEQDPEAVLRALLQVDMDDDPDDADDAPDVGPDKRG